MILVGPLVNINVSYSELSKFNLGKNYITTSQNLYILRGFDYRVLHPGLLGFGALSIFRYSKGQERPQRF
jgi:hypothetical protein